MQIENISRANRLVSILQTLKLSLVKIEELLNKNESDGGHTPSPTLYSFYITEYLNGREVDAIELTGAMISKEILTFVKTRVESRIKEIELEIETL